MEQNEEKLEEDDFIGFFDETVDSLRVKPSKISRGRCIGSSHQ